MTADIEMDGPVGDAARQAAINSPYIENNHFVRPEATDLMGVQLGGRYDGSPIIIADGPPPPETIDAYVPSGVPGGRAPHVWLDDRRERGSSLFDRFVPGGFTLLRFDATIDCAPLQTAAAALRMPFAILDVPAPEARRLYGRNLALIRPDHYLAWRGDQPPDRPDTVLARISGRY